MENKDRSAESGEMICSELDVPIITPEDLEPVITTFLNAITEEQWILLAADKITSSTFTQLCKMCSEILKIISSEVLKVVEPQVRHWMFIHATQHGHNMNNRNYYSLTEDDIKASIGNSFDCCFGEVTGIPQERSNESIALLELIVAEVKKRVNEKLAGLTSSDGQSASCPQTVESIDSETFNDYDYDASEMVHQVATILKCLLQTDTELPSYQDTVSGMNFFSSDQIVDLEKFCLKVLCTEKTRMCPVPPDVKTNVMKNMEDVILEEFSLTSPKSSEQNIGHKVRTFFNRKTSKVIPACDLNTSLSNSCAAGATITHPVPKMQRSDSEELNNSPPKNRSSGHTLKFFSRKKKNITELEAFCSEDSVTPTCENGSTQSSKLCGIMRILSSTGKILMKPFICCMSGEQ